MLPIKPTFRGGVIIGIAVIAFFIAMVNPSFPPFLIASILCAIVISGFVLSCWSLFGIEVSRNICSDGVRKTDVYIPLNIINKTKRRVQTLIVREIIGFSKNDLIEFAINTLLPLEARTLERYVLASKRGNFHLNKVELIGGDPAGLFQRVKVFELPGDLTIFPHIEKINSLKLQAKNKIRSSVSGQPLGISGQGQDVFGLREYRHGDPVRLVHWKASARQQRLVIKEFEAQGLNRISVILDVDRRYVGNDKYDNNFEYNVMSAASIINYLSGMYCPSSFITGCDEKGTILCETGAAYSMAGTVDAKLAELQPCNMSVEKLLEASLDIVPEDSILYCLTMSASDNLYKYFDQFSAKGIEVRWLFAPPEGFPKIIPGINIEEPDTSLFGYGMHSPTPFVIKRGLHLEDAIG